MSNISYFTNASDCYCCYDCEHHGINKRMGYIIPCENRNSCSKYQEKLRAQHEANEREKRESAMNAFSNDLEYSRRTKRKRRK